MSERTSGRRRPVTVESVGELALVAALVAAGGDVLIRILQVLVDGGNLEIVDLVRSQLVGAVGQAALVGGVVAIVFAGTTREFLIRVAAAIYAVEIAQSILDELLDVVLDGGTANFDGINLFIFPLYTVTTFLAFVMAYRLFQGKTILPGVDYRL